MEAVYLFLVLGTAGVILYASEKYRFVSSLGIPTWGYFAGIFLHLIGIPLSSSMFKGILQASALLIVPLMLLNADWKFLIKHGKEYLLAFGLGILSVSVFSLLSLLFFHYDEHTSAVAGMLVGVYTGGTPNLIAIGSALQVPEKYFFLLNTADIIASGIYLSALLTFLPWLLKKLWKEKNILSSNPSIQEKPTSVVPLKNYFYSLFAATGVVAISVGSVYLFYGKIEEEQIPLLMILISVLGLFPSLLLRNGDFYFSAAPKTGDFLIVLFCILLGNQMEISKLSAEDSNLFLHCFFVLFGSIVLFYFLNRIFGISYITAMLVDTAAVFSPPFVPVIASRLGVSKEAPLGILVGVLGYSVGNLVGIGFYHLIKSGII